MSDLIIPSGWNVDMKWTMSFLVSWHPGNIGNLSLQHSLCSWKYHPNPTPNPKPNPHPFLVLGWVNQGVAGGPGPKAGPVHGADLGRAGSRNTNPLGGCAPQTLAHFFSGRSGSSLLFLIVIMLLFLIQGHIFNVLGCF